MKEEKQIGDREEYLDTCFLTNGNNWVTRYFQKVRVARRLKNLGFKKGSYDDALENQDYYNFFGSHVSVESGSMSDFPKFYTGLRVRISMGNARFVEPESLPLEDRLERVQVDFKQTSSEVSQFVASTGGYAYRKENGVYDWRKI